MPKFYWMIVLLACATVLQAQNLVPNSSFEEIEDCDFVTGALANGWTTASVWGTPDLYHECAVEPFFQPPNVFDCEMQTPHTGEAFAGLYVYGEFGKEYLQIALTQELEAGKEYFIEFFVEPTMGCGPEGWRYTDNIGLAFSEEQLNANLSVDGNGILPIEVAVERTGPVINEVGVWERVSGCYTALGGEQYVIVGCFRRDSESTLSAQNPSEVTENYLFVDDIRVIDFFSLPDTTYLCENEITLTANFFDTTFLWNTNEIASSITVSQAGLYTAETTIEGCFFKDSTLVLAPIDESNSINQFVCSGDSVLLVPPVSGDYLWDDNSTSSFLEVRADGFYSVTVTNGECNEYRFNYEVLFTSCDCQVYVPNTFSPNDDGINDEFQYFFGCELPYQFKQFMVFNRWGSPVFSSTKEGEFWNGKVRNQQINSDMYLWVLEYEVEELTGLRSVQKSGIVNALK